ncbi:MAG: ca2+ sensor protein [Sphingomonas sp.]|uniref:EF-hand domain-containing protein n=1 Tax=Sphingomonas sp. TaxID=28214 RepID=UPI00121DDE5C|nr:EF-hand domain-containing protein [Sphingomonas sp.]THD35240.1 MAG: ca2+ sensor protein [Sphingomonas sp.]
MNRFLFAAILATAGFAAAGPLSAQTAPAPQDNPDRIETRDDALAKADQRFDRMDANHDGKIDATEMAAMRPVGALGTMPPAPPAGGAVPPPAPGGRMFARLDANGDGVIDRAEFRAQALRRFDRIDANHDGKIDAAERQAARDAMGMRGGRGPGGDMPPPPPPAPVPAS